MRGLLMLMVVCFLASAAIEAQRTSRRPLKVTPEPMTGQPTDTLVGMASDSVVLAGFDKPLRSRKETFFVTNNSSRTIEEMALTLNYFDSKGLQLHHRHLRLKRFIEPGSTVNVQIPTWDRQQSFYYVRSEVPKRVEQATPFDVRIAVDTVFVSGKP